MCDGSSDSGFPEAIASIDELEAYFHGGCKPRKDWKVGVEYEKPVVYSSTGEAVEYDGTRGIGSLLARMLELYSWSPVYENGKLIALRDGTASITLEPGGQFELSGEVCDSLHCADDELKRHVAEITRLGQEMGLSFLALGATPKTSLERMPWMPKGRYDIMREAMRRSGLLGHRMMQQTATVQANFDYSDERDASRKMRLAMALAPALVAMSANSPVIDGRPTGYRSYRAHVWTDTDPARCGVLPFVFDTDNLFGAYTQYALDVPMYFIPRGDRLIVTQGLTFRKFLQAGYEGERATMADWHHHLTTIFPEVRLKTYIETRSADSQPPQLMLAIPAFMKGLLYDDAALDAAWEAVSTWPLDELARLLEGAAVSALAYRVGRFAMLDYVVELTSISRAGLVKQACLDAQGEDESRYLDRLQDELGRGVCPAERIIELWEGPWGGEVDQLVRYACYQP